MPGKFTYTPNGKATPRRMAMPRTRIEKALSLSRSATPGTVTPKTRGSEALGRVVFGSKKRSGRLVGKVVNLREEDSDLTDKDFFDSPYSGYSTPAKRRKISRIPPTPASPSNDSDFVQDESEPDDDVPEAEVDSDEDVVSTAYGTPSRAAARKARLSISSSFISNGTPLVLKVPNLLPSPEKNMKMPPPKQKPTPTYMTAVFSPEVMQVAQAFSTRKPILLKPPVLSADRLRVDAASIYLYAADGCCNMEEMWASALSSSRFGGPRRHAPFRELHRLSDPSLVEGSDWAENIRWAKEQHRAFGSATWTEYDYHLELITEARRKTMWVSEEVVSAGM